MLLSTMKAGDKGKIIRVQPGNSFYRQRLIVMGLLPGTEFKITRIAPLGDPVEIAVRGFNLSLRKEEANILDILPVA